MMMMVTVTMMVKVAVFNDFHCHRNGHSGGGGEISGARGWPEKQRKHVFCFLPQFVLFSKACQLQTVCLETELRRLQAEQQRTSREEKEKKATLVEKKDEQFERKTEAMVPEREYRAVLQVSQKNVLFAPPTPMIYNNIFP